jgi:hypothetical protein
MKKKTEHPTSYKRARADIMKAMEVERALILKSTDVDDREKLLDHFEYLHSELAALDSKHLEQSAEAYRPLTIRLAHSAKELEADYEKAKQLAKNLNLSSTALDSMLNLVKALA